MNEQRGSFMNSRKGKISIQKKYEKKSASLACRIVDNRRSDGRTEGICTPSQISFILQIHVPTYPACFVFHTHEQIHYCAWFGLGGAKEFGSLDSFDCREFFLFVCVMIFNLKKLHWKSTPLGNEERIDVVCIFSPYTFSLSFLAGFLVRTSLVTFEMYG